MKTEAKLTRLWKGFLRDTDQVADSILPWGRALAGEPGEYDVPML